jgi:hypothetical protein
MMVGLLSGLVNAGQKSAAVNVLANARDSLETSPLRHSSLVKEALERLSDVEEKLNLLGEKSEGPME